MINTLKNMTINTLGFLGISSSICSLMMMNMFCSTYLTINIFGNKCLTNNIINLSIIPFTAICMIEFTSIDYIYSKIIN